VVNLEILGLSIGAFVATNIDDLFILIVFFAKRSFPTSQIILAQYVGMGLLLGVSLVGSLVALVIPHNLLGLIGLFPIAIGINDVSNMAEDLEIQMKDEYMFQITVDY
jgi:cadmium resistance protein CadD (predicted permease)